MYLKVIFINLTVFLIIIFMDTLKSITIYYVYQDRDLGTSLLFLLINDVCMLMTIVVMIYEWHFVIFNQVICPCQVVTSKIWKIGTVVSVIIHSFGVAYWFSALGFHNYEEMFVDIGYLYSLLLWFLCFCWEYLKMNRRSFVALVNRNLNLSLFISTLSGITLFESCISILITVNDRFFMIGFAVIIFGLTIINIKMYLLRQRQKEKSIMANNQTYSITIDKIMVLGLTLLMGGVITVIVMLSLRICHLILPQYIYMIVCLFVECFSIFFNIIYELMSQTVCKIA